MVLNKSKLLHKCVSTLALAGKSSLLLCCRGVAGLRHPKHLSVCRRETAGMLLDLLTRRGELAGDCLGPAALLCRCALLFDLRSLDDPRSLRRRGTRRVEFGPERDQFTLEGFRPVLLLL